jgi:DNA-nicking Smr family endonuclease
MEACNAKAAAEIFAHYNPRLAAGRRAPPREALAQVDLHGLYVAEALARASDHVGACRRAGVPRTVLITGRGNRSAGGLAKIKPAVEEWLRRERLVAYADVPNAGCITVDIDAKDKAPGWADSCVVM